MTVLFLVLKTYILNSIFTTDRRRKDRTAKNVNAIPKKVKIKIYTLVRGNKENPILLGESDLKITSVNY